ncbi:hypothetical protein ACVWWG_008690 [Bradyrhizobium sp. LB7.2]
MAADNPRGAMFRVILPNQHSRVTNAELFFDLVFVFAITQVSHTLLHHFTPLGGLHVTMLFLAVWWVWVYTAWVTNWLNPELTPVRVMLFSMMLGGLVLSTTIPTAFEGRGLWFAIAYAAMQVGRTAFWLFATPRHRTAVRHNAIRIPGLALRFRDLLDPRRSGARGGEAVVLDRGTHDRICLTRGPILGPQAGILVGRGLGRRRRSHGRALRRLHHHRAR